MLAIHVVCARQHTAASQLVVRCDSLFVEKRCKMIVRESCGELRSAVRASRGLSPNLSVILVPGLLSLRAFGLSDSSSATNPTSSSTTSASFYCSEPVLRLPIHEMP